MRFELCSVLLYVSACIAAGCNGNTKLCSRKYSEVTQVGSHDSPFIGTTVLANQGNSVTDQLNSGVRFLQAPVHKLLGKGMWMCHTSCLLINAGKLDNYLKTISNWLAANPNEVLTLLLTNNDNFAATDFGAAMTTSGLSALAYAPGKTLALSEWPTLQQLINAGKRLVVFLDSGANTAAVPYLLDEFTYFFETVFDSTDPAFNDCSVNRPAGASATGRMSIVNHFLDSSVAGILVPDRNAAPTTNSAASIEAQAALCKKNYGRNPNFFLLDYVELGSAFTAQSYLNSL